MYAACVFYYYYFLCTSNSCDVVFGAGEGGRGCKTFLFVLFSLFSRTRAAGLASKVRSFFRIGSQYAHHAGTFNMPTSYQELVSEREVNIDWAMVSCQGSTRSELP